MQNKYLTNPLRWVYLTGIFAVLVLPLLTLPPWFYPPDWGKTLMFRAILAILLVVLIWQLLWKKIDISPKVAFLKHQPVFLALLALQGIFLLATIFSVDPYYSFWASPYRGG